MNRSLITMLVAVVASVTAPLSHASSTYGAGYSWDFSGGSTWGSKPDTYFGGSKDSYGKSGGTGGKLNLSWGTGLTGWNKDSGSKGSSWGWGWGGGSGWDFWKDKNGWDKHDDHSCHYGCDVNPVPVPAAAYLFATGLGLLGWKGSRRSSNTNA